MIRQILIFNCLVVLILFSSCKKEIPDYNKKANEVIQQIILDEKCKCMDMHKETIIEINTIYSPQIDIRKKIIEKLNLRDMKELDSLERLSSNFILDTDFLKQHKITLIPRDSFKKLIKDPNFCRDGILVIQKPFFDKEFKNAFVKYGWAFLCSEPVPELYKYENGKWEK